MPTTLSFRPWHRIAVIVATASLIALNASAQETAPPPPPGQAAQAEPGAPAQPAAVVVVGVPQQMPMGPQPMMMPSVPPPRGALPLYPPGYGPANPGPRPVVRWHRRSMPYHGEAVPPGVEIHSRPMIAPVAAGGAAFIGAELGTVFVWLFSNICYLGCGPTPSGVMMIPIVGPWLALGDASTRSSGLAPYMVVYGILEDLGVAALALGLLIRKQSISVADPIYGSRARRPLDWALLPMASATGAGVQLAGAFF